MSALPEFDFELSAPEVAAGSFDPVVALVEGLALTYLLYKSFSERDARASLHAMGSDLTSISDRRRYNPSANQSALGFLLDGTPVQSVVPIEDHIQSLLPRQAGRRVHPAARLAQSVQPVRLQFRPQFQYGRAWASPYSMAQINPRAVAECVRRARRRQALFANGRLSSHARRRRRPGAISCYGY